MTRNWFLSLAAVAVMTAVVRAEDWPQWLGPNRDGVSPEKGLLKQWPKGGPKLAWQVNTIGLGFSTPSVVGDKLYVLGTVKDDEVLFCLDVANKGQDVWKPVKIGPVFGFQGNSWGDGPRAAPTVDGGLVYALGGFGDLVCVEAATGKEVWRTSMVKNLNGEVNPVGGGPGGWGYCWSPLVDGDQLIVVPGGKNGLLAALDKKTGKELWRSKAVTDGATYSSPILVTANGGKQVVATTNAGVVGVDARNGNLLWTYKKAFKDMIVPTPLVHDGVVFTTVGLLNFRPGVDAFEIPAAGTAAAKKKYANQDLACGVPTPVLVEGHVYGFSESKKTPGWVCMDFATGEVKWADETFEAGSCTAADGMLYCFGEETGAVALVEASPKGWAVKGEFTIPQKSKNLAANGKLWTSPVVANGKLFLRDQELLFCYEVK